MNRDQAEYLSVLGFDPRPFGLPTTHSEPPSKPLVDLPTLPNWTDLRGAAEACTACSLSTSRTKVVFGSGDAKAKLMFLGEAPSVDDDSNGVPFSGPAGQLLDKMIQAMGFSRADVYVANMVQCRPPQNRNPSADEVASCANFVRDQIRLVKPVVLVALGTVAAQAVLNTASPVADLRGRFLQTKQFGFELSVMPTYHPAFLMRNPDLKKLAWDDLKLVMARLSEG